MDSVIYRMQITNYEVCRTTVESWDFGTVNCYPPIRCNFRKIRCDTSDVYNQPETSDVCNQPETSDVYNQPETSDAYNQPETSDILQVEV